MVPAYARRLRLENINPAIEMVLAIIEQPPHRMLQALSSGWSGQLGDGDTLASNIQKLSNKQIKQGIEDFYGNMRLGIRRSDSAGGPSLHHGKGWDGKGIVTCHSFGCSYNMGKGPVEFL